MNILAPLWGWLIAGFLAFTSTALKLASRDLRHRASFVYWESILRYLATLLLITAGLFGDLGLIAVPLGLGDLAIGVVYILGLPKELALFYFNLS